MFLHLVEILLLKDGFTLPVSQEAEHIVTLLILDLADLLPPVGQWDNIVQQDNCTFIVVLDR
jgi:hypothetical protein